VVFLSYQLLLDTYIKEFLKDAKRATKIAVPRHTKLDSFDNPITFATCHSRKMQPSPADKIRPPQNSCRFTRGNRRIGSDRTRQHLLPPPSVPPRLLISSSKHLLNSTHRGWRINLWFVKWGLTSCFGQVKQFCSDTQNRSEGWCHVRSLRETGLFVGV
jgi:hypothetical protein